MSVKKIGSIVAVFAVSALVLGASGCDQQQNNSGSSNTDNKAQSTPEKKKPSSQEIYDKVQNGMTKAQVVEIAGKDPDNCIDSEIEGLGKSSTCSYGTLSITFQNGVVNSKTKL